MTIKCDCCGCTLMAKYAIKYMGGYLCRDCYKECDL